MAEDTSITLAHEHARYCPGSYRLGQPNQWWTLRYIPRAWDSRQCTCDTSIGAPYPKELTDG